MAGAAGSAALSLAVPGPEASTGLTPQVGALDLPPGIEGIVPSDYPLTGGWYFYAVVVAAAG
jgi:hypothetical protein